MGGKECSVSKQEKAVSRCREAGLTVESRKGWAHYVSIAQREVRA